MQKTITVSGDVAGQIQKSTADYPVAVVETGLMSGGKVRITLQGDPAVMESMFAFIGLEFDNESEGTATV